MELELELQDEKEQGGSKDVLLILGSPLYSAVSLFGPFPSFLPIPYTWKTL